MDLSIPASRQAALQRLLPLLQSIQSSTERTHAIRQSAVVFATTETALTDDLRRFEKGNSLHPVHVIQHNNTASLYSSADLTLGLFLLYPRHLEMLTEMILP